jgi:hypothetical protein
MPAAARRRTFLPATEGGEKEVNFGKKTSARVKAEVRRSELFGGGKACSC